jgi:hypothetical protein
MPHPETLASITLYKEHALFIPDAYVVGFSTLEPFILILLTWLRAHFNGG